MIKILFSADYNKIPADIQTAQKWGVDRVLRVGDLRIDSIPYDNEGTTYFVSTIIDSRMGLAYDGIRLALKIYLNSILQKRNNFRIVLLGFQTISNFLITYPFPNILKCQGIEYIFFNRDLVRNYNKPFIPIKFETLANELQNIGLTLPNSFKSTHSLTNEWSLYVWSKFIWGENIPIELSNSKSLYFSYLTTLYALETHQEKQISKILEDKFGELQGKILLIDDNPKWGIFFHNLFKNSPEVKFKYIGENFKNIEFEDIKTICKNEVKEFNPDIIFLDFRLSEDTDYEEKNNRKISGARILEFLKGNPANPGLAFNSSIMMFTATGKIENILMLKALNADGFILKERPEKYIGKTGTAKLFNELVEEINYRVDLSQYFVKIAFSLANLEISKDYIKVNEEYKQNISTTIQIIRNLQLSISALEMDNISMTVEYLKLMYLEFISLLEMLKKDKSDLNPFIKEYVKDISLNDWDNICDIRNSIAHGKSQVRLKTEYEGIYKPYCLNSDFLKEWTVKLATFVRETFKYLIQTKKIK